MTTYFLENKLNFGKFQNYMISKFQKHDNFKLNLTTLVKKDKKISFFHCIVYNFIKIKTINNGKI